MAHGALTPIIGLRLLALAAGLRHNTEIGQPGLCFSAYGHKFGINHLACGVMPTRDAPLTGSCACGAVAFEVTAPFRTAGCCHCRRRRP